MGSRGLLSNRLVWIIGVVKVIMHLRAACTASDRDVYHSRASAGPHRYANQARETDYGWDVPASMGTSSGLRHKFGAKNQNRG